MGKFVTPCQYFYLPNTVKHYMDAEKKMLDRRFVKLEDEVEKLKRGENNASEAESCQILGNEDIEDDPPEEPIDTRCYLAVEVATNIVATGTIMMDICLESIEVMMECGLQGEAPLPIPLEDELILKVKDGVGHILSWPRELVIRFSDLKKAVTKPLAKSLPEIESKKGKKRLREPTDNEKEINNAKGKENEKKPIEPHPIEQQPIELDKENEKKKDKGKDKRKGKENFPKNEDKSTTQDKDKNRKKSCIVDGCTGG